MPYPREALEVPMDFRHHQGQAGRRYITIRERWKRSPTLHQYWIIQIKWGWPFVSRYVLGYPVYLAMTL
eukprot:scaffold122791_cov33-Attheya_sp.AAC.7